MHKMHDINAQNCKLSGPFNKYLMGIGTSLKKPCVVNRIEMEVVHAKPLNKRLDMCTWDHRFNKHDQASSMLIDTSSYV